MRRASTPFQARRCVRRPSQPCAGHHTRRLAGRARPRLAPRPRCAPGSVPSTSPVAGSSESNVSTARPSAPGACLGAPSSGAFRAPGTSCDSTYREGAVDQTESFDYVIVGAGSAGCVLAARLTRGPGRPGAAARGGRRRPRSTRSTSRRRSASCSGPSSTGTTPRRSRSTRTAAACTCRAARCSAAPARSTRWSTSAATARDYDELGAPPARPAGATTTCCRTSCAPRTTSAARRSPRRRRAAAGVRGAARATEMSLAFVDGRRRPGLRARTRTSTAPEQDGVGVYQVTQRGGRRCSAAVAYLHPALEPAQPHGRDARAGAPDPVRGQRAVGVEAARSASRSSSAPSAR